MKYSLYGDAGESRSPVLSGEFDDNLSAENWAKGWARTNATGDHYSLEREDGGFAMSIFRTQAGQWYVTPKPAAEQALAS